MPEVVGNLIAPRQSSAPSSPATGQLYYDTGSNKLYCWNGTAWVDATASGGNPVYEQPGDPGAVAAGSIWIDTDDVPPAWVATVPLVTTLPGSPVDAQEVYFQADATNGIIWHLRYRAASASAYKWECVGGPPLEAFVVANEAPGSAAAWVNLTTAGPQVTVARAGEYLILGRATANRSNTTFDTMQMGVCIGDGTPADPLISVVNIGNPAVGIGRLEQVAAGTLACAASDVLKMRYYAVTTATGDTWRDRVLRVLPVRLS